PRKTSPRAGLIAGRRGGYRTARCELPSLPAASSRRAVPMTDLHDRLTALSPAKRALLDRLRVAGAAPIPHIAGNAAPLSAAHRGLWSLRQLAPRLPVYTIPGGFRLRGPVDTDALLGALRDMVERHEPLRTSFRESAGTPVQVVGEGAAF